MEESSALKLIIEKGPREGETLEYSSRSMVKIGRVVRGNTIAIKDAGISSKHICIQFDNESRKWILTDLDSSNGTVLNGQILKPYVPSDLKDDDCIKIGEVTSIIVKAVVESNNQSVRYPRRLGKSGAGAATVVVGRGRSELGLGFDGDLGGNAVEEPAKKRNLRSRAKKAVDSKIEAESLSSKRILRSSIKEEKVSCIPTLKQIPEKLNVNVRETTDISNSIEPRKTRGRKKKLPVQAPEDPDLDANKPTAEIVVPIDGRKTRRGRKGLAVETLEIVQSSGLEEYVNNVKESVRVIEGKEAASDKITIDQSKIVEDSGLEENLNKANESVRVDIGNDAVSNKFLINQSKNAETSGLEENLDTNSVSAQDHVVEKFGSAQEGCEGEQVVIDECSVKGPSETADVDKGKEVAEELGCRQDAREGLVNNTDHDNGQWPDLEKMTLGDFFDYLEVQLPKEIHEKSEKIISDLAEKARKCHEFRRQRNEDIKGKVAAD